MHRVKSGAFFLIPRIPSCAARRKEARSDIRICSHLRLFLLFSIPFVLLSANIKGEPRCPCFRFYYRLYALEFISIIRRRSESSRRVDIVDERALTREIKIGEPRRSSRGGAGQIPHFRWQIPAIGFNWLLGRRLLAVQSAIFAPI